MAQQFDWRRGVLSALGTPEEVKMYDENVKKRQLKATAKAAHRFSGKEASEEAMQASEHDPAAAKPREMKFSHDYYAELLRAQGFADEADAAQEQGIKLQAQRLKYRMDDVDAQLKVRSQAYNLLASGQEDLAMAHANAFLPEEQQWTQPPKMNPDGTVTVYTADNPNGQDVDPQKELQALSDAKTELAHIRNKFEEPVVDEKHGIVYQDNVETGERKKIATFDTVNPAGFSNEDIKTLMTLRKGVWTMTETKKFIGQVDWYGKMLAVAKDPSMFGDHSLIFAYMKVLDPDSAVREGEYAVAEDNSRLPGYLIRMYNRLLDKKMRLSDSARYDLLTKARASFDSSEKGWNRLMDAEVENARTQFGMGDKAEAHRFRFNYDFKGLEQEIDKQPRYQGKGAPKLSPEEVKAKTIEFEKQQRAKGRVPVIGKKGNVWWLEKDRAAEAVLRGAKYRDGK